MAGPGPLEGILVIALEQAVAAPLATAKLAEGGARVIKIERAEGDFARGYDRAAAGTSSQFAWLNGGKESLALDLKAAADRALLDRILARADVFVQNLGPGAAERLGLGAARLAAARPDLVICEISGFGPGGPRSGDKAYDLLIQAEAGLVAISGGPGEPGRIGVSVADIATGTTAALAITQALLRRARTGQGARLSLSLFGTLAEWMTVPLLNHEAGATPRRGSLAHPSIAPYGGFPTGDGGLVLLSVQSDREWRDLARLVGRGEMAEHPRFATNAARVENRAETDAAVAAWTAGQETEAAMAALGSARIAVGRVSEMADLAAHPHLARVSRATEGGTASVPAPAIGADWQRAMRVPGLDEHGAAIRAEFAP